MTETVAYETMDGLVYFIGYIRLFLKKVCAKPRRGAVLQIIVDNPDITVPGIMRVYRLSEGKGIHGTTLWSDLRELEHLPLIKKIVAPKKRARYRTTPVLERILLAAGVFKDKKIAGLEEEIEKASGIPI